MPLHTSKAALGGLRGLSNSRNIPKTLQIERKITPTRILQRHARESIEIKSFTASADSANSTSGNTLTTTFTRLPRKRMTDRYFDKADQLEKKGIWVRFRRLHVNAPHGEGVRLANGVWQAKWKTGGDRESPLAVEVEGRDEVDALIKDAGVGRSVYDLGFSMDFEADRVSWSAAPETRLAADDGAKVEVCVDTTIAKREGQYGDKGTHWCHHAGELQISKELPDSTEFDPTDAVYDYDTKEDRDNLSTELETFMAEHSSLFTEDKDVLGKTGVLAAHEEQYWKADTPGKVATMSEWAWVRMMAGVVGRG